MQNNVVSFELPFSVSRQKFFAMNASGAQNLRHKLNVVQREVERALKHSVRRTDKIISYMLAGTQTKQRVGLYNYNS